MPDFGDSRVLFVVFGPLWLPFWLLDVLLVKPIRFVVDTVGRTLRARERTRERSPDARPARRPAPVPALRSPPASRAAEPSCPHGWPVAGLEEVPARPCPACERVTPAPTAGSVAPASAEPD